MFSRFAYVKNYLYFCKLKNLSQTIYMKKTILLTLLFAAMFCGCKHPPFNTTANEYFNRYSDLMRGIESAVHKAYLTDSTNIEGTWPITFGQLAGDSLSISKTADKKYILTSNNEKSSLKITTEVLNQYIHGEGSWKKEIYPIVLKGNGTYKISADSTFTYEISDIGGEMIYYYPYPSSMPDDGSFSFTYWDGGTITLSLSTAKRTRTYHYKLVHTRITCQETGEQVMSYDK